MGHSIIPKQMSHCLVHTGNAIMGELITWQRLNAIKSEIGPLDEVMSTVLWGK